MRAHVSFLVEIPDDLTDDEASEWIEYHLNARSSISGALHDRLGALEANGHVSVQVQRDPWPEPLEEKP